MKAAVNTVYSLLCKNENDSEAYAESILSWEQDTPSAGTILNNSHPSHSFILTGR